MNKEELAELLNGREYLSEMSNKEEELAEESGLVVIFGYSDDYVELRGAIYNEIGSWEGTTLYFSQSGLLENECKDDDCPYFVRLKGTAKTIEVIWGRDGYSWIYETNIPHATFDIFEDGEQFCRGIVFDIKDLK